MNGKRKRWASVLALILAALLILGSLSLPLLFARAAAPAGGPVR